MIFTAHPVEFEIHDETNTLAAKVTMFDDACATVEIKSVMNRHSFDALVPAIQKALTAMKLEGDV